MSKLTTTETLKKLTDEWFTNSSVFRNGVHTVKTSKNGLEYTRTGVDLEQCIKSLYYDIKKL